MARKTTITIILHPIILSFTDPTHLAQTTPRIFHLSAGCQFAHLSPSALLRPSGSARLRTFHLAFLPSQRAHPSTLSALHQSCLPGLSGWMAALVARYVLFLETWLTARVDCAAIAVMVKIWGTKLLMRQSTKWLWYGSTVNTTESILSGAGSCSSVINDN